jgi:hypothetical protein
MQWNDGMMDGESYQNSMTVSYTMKLLFTIRNEEALIIGR